MKTAAACLGVVAALVIGFILWNKTAGSTIFASGEYDEDGTLNDTIFALGSDGKVRQLCPVNAPLSELVVPSGGGRRLLHD